ncbi:MAG: sugar ABC transporter ATP-binding protein, partial [Streptosporangiaceae bacterium]|nr:sugar ABC transporter ATP-binding protein [Streptosporangiaceae bacterium]
MTVSYPVITVSDATRRYGEFAALADVTFAVARGECLAVVGENGAGKSTLMRLITGADLPTSGVVAPGGDQQPLTSTRMARHHGIVLIPQELAYLPDDTVTNNISIGVWPSRYGALRKKSARRRAAAILDQLGANIDVRARMRDLTLGQRQIVELGKALALRDITLLCLDEPTAALNVEETRHLLDILSGLKARGVGLIYVSHRLDELRQIADRVLVLRNGRNVGILGIEDASPSTLTGLMLGRAAAAAHASLSHASGARGP